MQSLWKSTVQLPDKKQLMGNTKVENVVIGGGMAGILIAYFLKKAGQQVIVLEAGKIASGQTENTTAKITSQHGFIYYDMIQKAGKNRAKASGFFVFYRRKGQGAVEKRSGCSKIPGA